MLMNKLPLTPNIFSILLFLSKSMHYYCYQQQLTQERLDQDKKINHLMAQNKDSEANNGMDEKDIKTSPIFIDLHQKQSSTESQVKNLEKELQSVKERWALSKGDILTANKTIRSLEEKHQKHLRELSGGGEGQLGQEASKKGYLNQAKLVMELEHKLKHALDNVRQSESVRVSLADAHCMNDTLQRQIGELKGVNEELKAEHNGEDGGVPQDPGISKERLYKMKKDISELKYKCEVSPMQMLTLMHPLALFSKGVRLSLHDCE